MRHKYVPSVKLRNEGRLVFLILNIILIIDRLIPGRIMLKIKMKTKKIIRKKEKKTQDTMNYEVCESFEATTQQTHTCSKSTKEILENVMKFVESYNKGIKMMSITSF